MNPLSAPGMMVYDGAEKAQTARRYNRDTALMSKLARFRLAKTWRLRWRCRCLHFLLRAEVQTEFWGGQRALAIIVQLLKFTPRSMGAPGHQQTID